ncbi:DUF4870 domain-containing protein [Flavobacterium sp.]|jgi:uncharacterized Tic20 family protein|uniref:DUF4870 domain-containing protein n=1 Tax=Flavobacterium sp. TaxID=239 RepID=UPI002A826B20|nr:DUF4870 domain-containing protein [Flavobacterium sp.]
METSNEKSTATLIHLTTLCQYIIPFSSFILPLLIWSNKKNESKFIDHHGKQALNFQLSMFLYSIVFIIIAVPTFILWLINTIDFSRINEHEIYLNEIINYNNITGYAILGFIAILLFFFIKLGEFFLIIYASAKTSNGEYYKYPLTIPFLK